MCSVSRRVPGSRSLVSTSLWVGSGEPPPPPSLAAVGKQLGPALGTEAQRKLSGVSLHCPSKHRADCPRMPSGVWRHSDLALNPEPTLQTSPRASRASSGSPRMEWDGGRGC